VQHWSAEELREYTHQRLAEVGIHASPFEPNAETLLVQSAQGLPRTLNALLQRAMERAARANRRNVTAADVQAALDELPWLARAALAA
jgi:type II secretory pathway predicted ATPase ExeA